MSSTLLPAVGKACKVDFAIENSEIHITCSNIQAINFHPCIDARKLYIISKGSINPAKKEFNHLKNDWEISLGNTSTIEPLL